MDLTSMVLQMRNQGLTDEQIAMELRKQGVNDAQISSVLGNSNPEPMMTEQSSFQAPTSPSISSKGDNDMMYSRMEEIAEGLIDEKWDELITEVKKILAWKDKVEERQKTIENEISLLKENFKTLHQGVLGKLDEYDTQMRDTRVELKAVGKVFKDVVPTFVENVKELSDITENIKKK